MKAAVTYEFGKPLVVEEIEMASPGKGEVKVKLAATAVCHSDIHDIKGELPGTLPFIGGHESAGIVEETGPDVSELKAGDRVMVTLLSSCGKCYYCLSGLPHLCVEKHAPQKNVRLRTKDGQPIEQKGKVSGFAEYALVSDSQLMKIPDDMPLESAALMSCGVITGFGAVVNRVKVKAMESVVVMGLGGVGINSIQGAALSGAYPIIGMDVLDEKMATAMEFGATHTVNATRKDAAEAVRELTYGRGADYVFITVGSVAAMNQGMMLTGARGNTVLIGLPPIQDQLSFPPIMMIGSEKVITGAYMGSTNLKTDIPRMIALYRAGQLKLDELITARYPLEKINDAIESTASGKALRNVIVFE